MFNPQVIQTIFVLTAISWGLVNGLVTPLFDKNGWDKFYLMYVAWAISGILTALMGLNIFTDDFLIPVVGQVVTALAAGILSNFIHDITDPEPQIEIMATNTTVAVSEDPEPQG